MLTGLQVYPLIAFIAYLGSCIAEFRMHRINYPFLLHVGGEELSRMEMRRYYRFWHVWFPALILLMIARNFWQPQAFGTALDGLSLISVAVMVLVGMGMRIWAIFSLGRLWSLRCVYVPDMPPVRSGPYRWFKHPEYLGRSLEGVALMLLVGAPSIAILLVFFSAWQIYRLCSVEYKQIVELAPT